MTINPIININGEERPMTDEEFQEFKIWTDDIKKMNKRQSDEAKAKDEAKASAFAKLTALGLTEDEVNGLIS
jgi:hypothetical protein